MDEARYFCCVHPLHAGVPGCPRRRDGWAPIELKLDWRGAQIRD
jgi:hypothetical protein